VPLFCFKLLGNGELREIEPKTNKQPKKQKLDEESTFTNTRLRRILSFNSRIVLTFRLPCPRLPSALEAAEQPWLRFLPFLTSGRIILVNEKITKKKIGKSLCVENVNTNLHLLHHHHQLHPSFA
jgi:hypothetical protein